MLKMILSYFLGRSMFESNSNNKNLQLLEGKVIVGDRLYPIDDLKNQLAASLNVLHQAIFFNAETNAFYISGSNATYPADDLVNKSL